MCYSGWLGVMYKHVLLKENISIVFGVFFSRAQKDFVGYLFVIISIWFLQ